MQAQSNIPAHLLAILAGQGPRIADAAPVVQARATQRAPRFQQGEARSVDALQWDEPECFTLTHNESATGMVHMGEL